MASLGFMVWLNPFNEITKAVWIGAKGDKKECCSCYSCPFTLLLPDMKSRVKFLCGLGKTLCKKCFSQLRSWQTNGGHREPGRPGNPYWGGKGLVVGGEVSFPGGIWVLENESNFNCQRSDNQRKRILLCKSHIPVMLNYGNL